MVKAMSFFLIFYRSELMMGQKLNPYNGYRYAFMIQVYSYCSKSFNSSPATQNQIKVVFFYFVIFILTFQKVQLLLISRIKHSNLKLYLKQYQKIIHMKLSRNSWKYNCKQSRKSTNFQQSQSEIYIPFADILFGTLTPKLLQIQRQVIGRLKQKFLYKKNAKQKYLQAFTNHCAALIQSNYRGFIQRKRYKAFLPIYRRFKQIFVAGIKGWKTRQILKLSIIIRQKNSIKQNSKLKRQKEARIGKRQFVDDFNRLYKNGNWIQILNKQAKYEPKNRQYNKRQQSQRTRQNLPLYENIKAVKNLKDFFRTRSNEKRQVLGSDIQNRSSLKQNIQMNSKLIINKKYPIKMNQIAKQVSSHKQNTAKVKNDNEKFREIHKQVCLANKTQKNSLSRKMQKYSTQLQIQIQPQVEQKLDFFSTPKYHQSMIRRKRILNLQNSLKSNNKNLTLKNTQNENISNNIIVTLDKDNNTYINKSNCVNKEDCFSVHGLQKRKEKKGLAMTLSKNFQFQVKENNRFDFLKQYDSRDTDQKNQQVSQFDKPPTNSILIQQNIPSNQANCQKKSIKKGSILNIEISKQNFCKKKFQQEQRHKQIVSKIQMLKMTNHFRNQTN